MLSVTAPGFADFEADYINIKFGDITHLDVEMEIS